MTNLDMRMSHRCVWHLPEQTEQTLRRVKPFPGALYYLHGFVVECPKCHQRVIVWCKTVALRAAEMEKYPRLGRFPK